jgi:sulfatase maturation enzyme AslB (radical SAM superfamily)
MRVRLQGQRVPGFHLLAKPTSATCNLDCSYCFFLSKELLYPGSRSPMADCSKHTSTALSERGSHA